jgi:hypothetical protein
MPDARGRFPSQKTLRISSSFKAPALDPFHADPGTREQPLMQGGDNVLFLGPRTGGKSHLAVVARFDHVISNQSLEPGAKCSATR